MGLGLEREDKHVRQVGGAVTPGCSAPQAGDLNLKSRATGVF